MRIRILIAEDDNEQYRSLCRQCRRSAVKLGFVVEDDSIDRASTVKEVESFFNRRPFNYDIAILDIGFGKDDLDPNLLRNYLQTDTLSECKVMINSGDIGFTGNPDKIISAICNGATTISIKGRTDEKSFATQFERLLREIQLETVWANIGRFSPQWKRNMFKEMGLWQKLKEGKKCNKIMLLMDISRSTTFVQTQRKAAVEDADILVLFKDFARITTEILEQDKYRGIVERYVGDEILAYFGMARRDARGCCKRAIDAAVEIREGFNTNYAKLHAEYGYQDIVIEKVTVKPELRILLGCGEVMWLLQGTDTRPQLSIMTDKVAKCYRIFTYRDKQDKREIQPNQIYVTHDVCRRTRLEVGYAERVHLDIANFGKTYIYQFKEVIL